MTIIPGRQSPGRLTNTVNHYSLSAEFPGFRSRDPEPRGLRERRKQNSAFGDPMAAQLHKVENGKVGHRE